jgi:uncharacterized repeat protein (TIGR03803 family)
MRREPVLKRRGRHCQAGLPKARRWQRSARQRRRELLHSFRIYPDGMEPAAALIDVNGMLYGTTLYTGGSYGGTVFSISRTGMHHAGTIFRISTTGNEHVLHTFGVGSPVAGLIDVNGTLYGTTSYGGTTNAGVVFAFTP